MVNELNEMIELFDEFYFIDGPETKQVKENENPIKINFEGGNKTGLVFIYNQPLNAIDADMIDKLIHKAMKIKMEDIALVDLSANSGIAPLEMINVIKAKRVVLWGVSNWLKEDLILYELTNLYSVRFLAVDNISAFHENVALKTTLWSKIQLLLK